MCDSESCNLPASSATIADSSDYLPPLSVLKGLKLLKLSEQGQKEEVNSETLWTNQECLIYLVRRPGCVLCRVKIED